MYTKITIITMSLILLASCGNQTKTTPQADSAKQPVVSGSVTNTIDSGTRGAVVTDGMPGDVVRPSSPPSIQPE